MSDLTQYTIVEDFHQPEIWIFSEHLKRCGTVSICQNAEDEDGDNQVQAVLIHVEYLPAIIKALQAIVDGAAMPANSSEPQA